MTEGRSTVLTIEVTVDDLGVGLTSRLSSPYRWLPGDLVRVTDAIIEHLTERVHPSGEVKHAGKTEWYDRFSGATKP
jgi:hypothetical protein